LAEQGIAVFLRPIGEMGNEVLYPANGNGNNDSPKVRDRLCQLIRQHQLEPTLVKAYATDFCGVKTLREASRERGGSFFGSREECCGSALRRLF
jgi:hypothetical protein